MIEIELASGGRMRITGPVDARTVAALMKALAKSKRASGGDDPGPERRAGLGGGRFTQRIKLSPGTTQWRWGCRPASGSSTPAYANPVCISRTPPAL